VAIALVRDRESGRLLATLAAAGRGAANVVFLGERRTPAAWAAVRAGVGQRSARRI
jgi:hypothetical protein